jgi:hypothetical protein
LTSFSLTFVLPFTHKNNTTDYDLFVGQILPAFPEVTRHNGNVLCYAGDPSEGAEYIGAMKMFLRWCKDNYAYVDGGALYKLLT